MARIQMNEAFANPAASADALVETVPAVRFASGRRTHGCAIIEIELDPLEWADFDYPTERARIAISQDSAYAYPMNAQGRQYHHREACGNLCMWFPWDPEAAK